MSGLNDDPTLNDNTQTEEFTDDPLNNVGMGGGMDEDDEELDEQEVEFPESLSQSIWYEKIYESEDNSEIASHLVM